MLEPAPGVIWANRFLGHITETQFHLQEEAANLRFMVLSTTASIYILTVHSIMLTQTEGQCQTMERMNRSQEISIFIIKFSPGPWVWLRRLLGTLGPGRESAGCVASAEACHFSPIVRPRATPHAQRGVTPAY